MLYVLRDNDEFTWFHLNHAVLQLHAKPPPLHHQELVLVFVNVPKGGSLPYTFTQEGRSYALRGAALFHNDKYRPFHDDGMIRDLRFLRDKSRGGQLPDPLPKPPFPDAA